MGNSTSITTNNQVENEESRISQQSQQSRKQEEPPLYAQLRRGESCDWSIVDAKLQKISQSMEYIRYCDQVENDMNTNHHKSNQSGIVLGHGQAVPMSNILGEVSDLQWHHPTSGVNALHVCVCWNPPLNTLESFLKTKIQSPHIHLNLAWEKNNKGATPLHYACANASDVAIIKALIQSACDHTGKGTIEQYIKAQTYDKGYTSLHSAVNANASLEVFQLLVESCPRVVLMKDNHGFTPLNLLCHNFHQLLVQVIKLLSNHDLTLHTVEDDGRDLSRKIPKKLEQLIMDKLQKGREPAFINIMEGFWSKATFLLRSACSTFMNSVPSHFKTADCTSNDYLLHAIASIPVSYEMCPPLLLRLLMASLSDQTKIKHGPNGDLPLHIAARAVAYSSSKMVKGNQLTLSSSTDYIIRNNLEALNTLNDEGQLPLEVAITSVRKRPRKNGQKIEYSSLRKILSANPSALSKLDMSITLYPMLLEKFSNKETQSENTEEFTNLNAIYQTMRNKLEIMHI